MVQIQKLSRQLRPLPRRTTESWHYAAALMSHCDRSCADTTLSQMSQPTDTKPPIAATNGMTSQLRKGHKGSQQLTENSGRSLSDLVEVPVLPLPRCLGEGDGRRSPSGSSGAAPQAAAAPSALRETPPRHGPASSLVSTPSFSPLGRRRGAPFDGCSLAGPGSNLHLGVSPSRSSPRMRLQNSGLRPIIHRPSGSCLRPLAGKLGKRRPFRRTASPISWYNAALASKPEGVLTKNVSTPTKRT